MNDQVAATANFENKVHRYGKITSYALCILFFLTPVAVQTAFGIEVDFQKTLLAFTTGFAVFGPGAFAEFISYAPILGAGGQYLAFTTGNIMNMKMPVAASGLKLCSIDPGTPRAEPITMIAVGVSSLVTTAILFLGLMLSARMLPTLQAPQLAPAFDNIMPAILGAVATPVLLKNLKQSSLPCALSAGLTIILGYSTIAARLAYLIPVFLVVSVAWAYFLYKRNHTTTSK